VSACWPARLPSRPVRDDTQMQPPRLSSEQQLGGGHRKQLMPWLLNRVDQQAMDVGEADTEPPGLLLRAAACLNW
jgi:hypothetical protein